ncbi:P-loop containing nucleoside triphosphate hydrolase protein [Ephemerocybe angulata]|uniref:P-loop containing nucleoside triphosphate hydrolase protein n=1 Tax=Ephemerocybe angulata TaxID=980116 RepID=A0A8H6LUI9_9AGAR|nr:P-loop containing nucleoside triphosphate hydrolase protein [Tulosesus angulatus]
MFKSLLRSTKRSGLAKPHSEIPHQPIKHNIILFGESGVGKSSIINMLQGGSVAAVASTAKGCTLKCKKYEGEINGQHYVYWDTAGFNEGDEGSVPEAAAVKALYKLLCNLEDGVSLLVFCMRGPRCTAAGTRNWSLFQHIICQDAVPAVIAITYMENEEKLPKWWKANMSHFHTNGMKPSTITNQKFNDGGKAFHSDIGVACITATKGLRDMLEDEYFESCRRIRKLVFESHLTQPWKVERVIWFKNVVEAAQTGLLCGMFSGETLVLDERIKDFMVTLGMKAEEASQLAKILEKS